MVAARTSQVPGWNWISLVSTVWANRSTASSASQATDLASIYFAFQASYEQQLVNANQQALAAMVRQYKAAYAKELGQLSALLTTAPTTPPGFNVRPPTS
jgi:hypothetical protein